MPARVFTAPELNVDERAVFELIGELREQMRSRGIAEPRRWAGGLRRMSEARAVQQSNSIEGYNASLDDVIAVHDGDEPMDASEETQLALEGYQEAMTYVLQAAKDPELTVDEGLLRALHFMMIKHDLSKNPGRWRPGAIHVARTDTGEIVYEGPDADLVPGLIAEMLEDLQSDCPVLVKAAMAHLNLAMIHPFSDGNGRMARCLQTLVLAREQIVAPVFSSIEEYLGRNTQQYYDVLAEIGRGSWHPENDARPWVRFCLTAHYRQAKTVLRRLDAFHEMWTVASRIAEGRRLPERTVGPIAEAAYGLRIRRATYLQSVEITWGEPIADLTASRDLRALVNAGLLIPIGDTRGRYYVGTDDLKAEWQQIRNKWPREPEADDPFNIVAERAQLKLDVA
jgi:Fic family protein